MFLGQRLKASFKPTGGVTYSTDLTIFGSTATADATLNLTSALGTGNDSKIWFKPDGTILYVNNSTIYRYDLSTAWDLSTASANGSFTVNNSNKGICISADGLHLYSAVNNANIYYRPFGTAWDVTTLGSQSSKGVSNGSVRGIGVSEDGTKGLYLGSNGTVVYSFELTTAFAISTLTNETFESSVTGNELFFALPDGTRFWEGGKVGVRQYDMSPAWTGTASSASSAILNTTHSDVRGLYVGGGKAFFLDNGIIYQYNL